MYIVDNLHLGRGRRKVAVASHCSAALLTSALLAAPSTLHVFHATSTFCSSLIRRAYSRTSHSYIMPLLPPAPLLAL